MKKKSSPASQHKPPTRFQEFGRAYPAVMAACQALGEATAEAGPLDDKTRALVKLAIAVGAWREGAVHSQTRRALAAGCSPDEIRHVVLLATTTLGFRCIRASLPQPRTRGLGIMQNFEMPPPRSPSAPTAQASPFSGRKRNKIGDWSRTLRRVAQLGS